MVMNFIAAAVLLQLCHYNAGGKLVAQGNLAVGQHTAIHTLRCTCSNVGMPYGWWQSSGTLA